MELVRDGSLKTYRRKRYEKFIVTQSDLQGSRSTRKSSLPSFANRARSPTASSSKRAVADSRNDQDSVVSKFIL